MNTNQTITPESLQADYDWENVFMHAEFGICDIAEVGQAIEGENDGDDWIIWGRLKTGQWFYAWAGCDYTGWDCQSAGDSYLADTAEELFRLGMTTSARQRFGIPEPTLASDTPV